MSMSRGSQAGRLSGLACLGGALVTLIAMLVVSPTSALAEVGQPATYRYTQTIPAPPASSYSGSGGGDGWALAMTPEAVYSVFRQSPQLGVACHLQSDGSACWAPKVIRDANSNDFAISGQPGLWLDQASGHLYVYATRSSDATAGVVCVDTTKPAADPNPFCGFSGAPRVIVGDNGWGFSFVAAVLTG